MSAQYRTPKAPVADLLRLKIVRGTKTVLLVPKRCTYDKHLSTPRGMLPGQSTSWCTGTDFFLCYSGDSLQEQNKRCDIES